MASPFRRFLGVFLAGILVSWALFLLVILAGWAHGILRVADVLVMITVTGSMAILVALLGQRLARAYRSPVSRLVDFVAQLGRGEAATCPVSSRIPEYQALCDGLDHLSDQLRSRVEHEVRSRHHLEVILQSMAAGIIVLDYKGCIRVVNQMAVDFFGLSATEAPGKYLVNFFRNSELDDLFRKVRELKTPVSSDMTMIRNEELRVLELYGAPLSTPLPEEHGVLLVLSDKTELRRLEEVRRDFVANVSHELRTPITAIKGFVENLASGMVDDPETAKHFLGIVGRQADRMQAIIEDLLTLSRLEQTGGKIVRNHECLADILTGSVEVCLSNAELRKSTITLQNQELGGRAGFVAKIEELAGAATVYCNRNLLEQALINLVDNAIKYSQEGAIVDLSWSVDQQYFRFDIRDNGPGIPAMDQKRLFERFYRVDKGRSRNQGGTGLGLAIVNHIASCHGGKVGLKSTSGVGSTFSIYFPLA